MKRRDILLGAAGAAWGVRPAWSQSRSFLKPGMTLKYVVPFEAGGLPDVMARTVAPKLAEAWKTPMLVENLAGGNALIGADKVAKSAPDGSHLLAITLNHAANVSLFPTAQFSLTEDLRPVALLATAPMLIVVSKDSPIKDFGGLLVASKGRWLNAGTSGNGSAPHLAMALFNDLNNSRMSHLPYRGGPPAIAELVKGKLDVIFSSLPESIAEVRSGRLRALAVCSLGRFPLLPDVPTAMELGFSGLFVEDWTGAMIQSGTPDTIVADYSREIMKIMSGTEVAEHARQQGFRVTPMGTGDFDDFLKRDIDRWSRIIRLAKISAA